MLPSGSAQPSVPREHVIASLRYLTDAERLVHTQLERKKDESQQQLGIATDNIEEISNIVHQLRTLEALAIARRFLAERQGGLKDAGKKPGNSPGSALAV
jgi:hypothetical protein